MSRTTRQDRSVVVLESVPEPRPTTNPYVVMLLESLGSTEGVEALTFGWRRALFASYDVFHVHWPEILVTTGTGTKLFARQAMFMMLVLRLTLRGIPVVRTLHNLAPHEGLSWRARFLLRLLDRRTALAITINLAPAPSPGPPTRRILHGHYRDWYGRQPRSVMETGRLGFFGLIRPYKGVDELVHAFAGTSQDLSLAVAGNPQSPELGDDLRRRAVADPRIDLRLRFLSDAELVDHIDRSELIVLPYRTMLNSGGVLAALSLDRPVLVPDNASNRALAAEVGPDWVRLYRGDLTSETLERETAHVRGSSGTPDLTARDWGGAGTAHRDAFVEALASKGRRTRLRRAAR